MANYLAQCKHHVNKTDEICPVCKTKIERIWNIDELGINNANKLAEHWNTSMKPQEFIEKRMIPYDRDECIYAMCAAWDEANPLADEETRMKAFRNLVNYNFREEYNRSVEKEPHKYYYLLDTFSHTYVHL